MKFLRFFLCFCFWPAWFRIPWWALLTLEQFYAHPAQLLIWNVCEIFLQIILLEYCELLLKAILARIFVSSFWCRANHVAVDKISVSICSSPETRQVKETISICTGEVKETVSLCTGKIKEKVSLRTVKETVSLYTGEVKQTVTLCTGKIKETVSLCTRKVEETFLTLHRRG